MGICSLYAYRMYIDLIKINFRIRTTYFDLMYTYMAIYIFLVKCKPPNLKYLCTPLVQYMYFFDVCVYMGGLCFFLTFYTRYVCRVKRSFAL